MKTCSGCKVEKSLESFYKNKNMRDGYQSQCKACANEASARSEKKNPEKYYKIRKKANHTFRDKLRAYKVERGCRDCGENHPAVLELHHTDPSVKDIHPSSASGLKLFLEEAEKCIVLCANCHRKVHYGV